MMSQSSRLAKLFDTITDNLPVCGPILLIRATDNPAYHTLDPAMVHCIQSFKPDVDTLERIGLTAHKTLPQNATAAIVELTRSKQENLSNIAKAHAALRQGATLYIDGAKTDGIDSISKAVKKLTAVDGSYAKAHGKAIWLTKKQNDNPFQDWLDLTDCGKNKDGFWTVPGIFSAGAIDPASAFLCANITQPLSGKGADLGAGWGYLSHHALQKYPKITQLDLFEAEHISLDCAQKNITDTRALFHWSDITAMPVKAVHDFILMNPPFHVSRKADPSIGRMFIAKAANMLNPKGRLWMVANKQLPYEACLDDHFNTWSYIAQSSQYKIIQARRPK
jgi:16S rRNA (guanine1207-N2)-methyltransferase